MQDLDAGYQYLKEARKALTQREIASFLGRDIRTIKRWEARQTTPPKYLVPALQQLLFSTPGNQPLFGEFTFVDLFAGIGGTRMAFEALGGQCVFTSEWDTPCTKTYLRNFASTHQIAGDITKIHEKDIPDHDVLLAGFPCQPFSIAGVSKKNALGRAHGFLCETQGTLFFDVARIVAEKKPKAFLLENVKNILRHDRGKTFEVIRRTLEDELEYHIEVTVIDAKRFVPQHRERVLIAGFRENTGFDWRGFKFSDSNARAITLASILHPEDGSEKPEEPYTLGPKAQVNPKYILTDHLWNYLQKYAERHRKKGNGFGFGLVGPDDIARTLSARYFKDGSEILINRGKKKNPRRLTPRECARLMGFRNSFKIPVSDTQAYKQFGNSVVVPLIQEAARVMKPHIMELVEEEQSGRSQQRLFF